MVYAPKWGNRVKSVVVCCTIAVASTRCVSDFVGGPKGNVPPTAVAVIFTSQPANAVAGTSLGSSIQVAVVDSLGHTVTGGNTDVTLALAGGKANAHLRGTVTATTSEGIATFSGISVDSAGSGYTLSASAGSLARATSQSFGVSAGPAVRLVFASQPSNTVAMKTIAPTVRVSVADSLGNTVDANVMVDVSLNLGTTAGTPTLVGDTHQGTDNGVASFDDLRVSRTGAGFTLTARVNGMPAVTSRTFDVLEPNDVIAVRITTQPGNAFSGGVITPGVRVVTVNSLGNVVTTAVVQVSLALVTGTGPAGAHLGGTTSLPTSGGEAVFNNLTVDSAGAGYRLEATAPSLTADTSTAFNITAGATARLKFIAQTSGGDAGAVLTPATQVAVLDAAGNVVTTSTAQVAVYITAGTGTPGAVLGGTASVAASGGVATFNNLTISAAGTGYTLTAVAASLASDVSAPFTVTAATPPPAVASVVVSPPNATLVAFGASQQFTAQALDGAGQPMAGVTFTWSSSNTAVATIDANGAATAVANGTSTITATSGTVSGTATLTVQQSVGGVAADPNNVNLNPGDSVLVTATARDPRNNPVSRPVTFAWNTANPTLMVTADTANTAQAWIKRIGITSPSATATVSAEGKSATVTLH